MKTYAKHPLGSILCGSGRLKRNPVSSALCDDLLDRGFHSITVLDLSGAALSKAKERLGARAARVDWIEADVTRAELLPFHYDVWHDRAVFHFLADADERRRYINAAARALNRGGHLIIATFAADGPQQCSGLTTARYSPEQLQAEFGEAFALVGSESNVHLTPSGTQQKFTYCHFTRLQASPGQPGFAADNSEGRI